MNITTIENRSQSMLHKAWEHIYYESQKLIGETNVLINKADSSLFQPTINFGRKYYPTLQTLSKKVVKVMVKTIKLAIIIGLFFVNATFFLLGAATAIVFPEQMRSAVSRISKVWDSLPKNLRFCIFAPFPFAWPSYFIIASPFVGAAVSLHLQDKAGVVLSPSPRV